MSESGPHIDPIIETRKLSKSYRRFAALRELDLRVPRGAVFALLGANGAGKTTLIKVLLNMTAPTGGSAALLGVDSRAIGPAVLAQVGYASENQALPLRLRVDQFFSYLRPCYVNWDPDFEQELRAQFDLPPKRRIGQLSHGMRMKMALACALPFRPKVLILDEPLSGLDPLARDEVIGGFMRHAGESTLLISSHELDEVERFATHVGFVHEGRLLFQGSMGALAEHARSLSEGAGGRSTARPSLRDVFVAMVRVAKQTPAESLDP